MAGPQLGQWLSLISKLSIRYEGKLAAIDPGANTLTLSNVSMKGTEGRPAAAEIAPSDQIYDYIVFRGNDIKDLTVFGDQPAGMPPDPAIVQAGQPLPLAQQQAVLQQVQQQHHHQVPQQHHHQVFPQVAAAPVNAAWAQALGGQFGAQAQLGTGQFPAATGMMLGAAQQPFAPQQQQQLPMATATFGAQHQQLHANQPNPVSTGTVSTAGKGLPPGAPEGAQPMGNRSYGGYGGGAMPGGAAAGLPDGGGQGGMRRGGGGGGKGGRRNQQRGPDGGAGGGAAAGAGAGARGAKQPYAGHTGMEFAKAASRPGTMQKKDALGEFDFGAMNQQLEDLRKKDGAAAAPAYKKGGSFFDSLSAGDGPAERGGRRQQNKDTETFGR
eukprot:TRINITY_DN5765_c2_g1_i1.p1 TRINITY_DN5765_c2_g1~~TRINITY_DN5765_c2_g1_i1.p1  ORF type:complete len:382 (+),score=107.48 TRINITY_DN5765_c2_g1_i1:125-1270(+)